MASARRSYSPTLRLSNSPGGHKPRKYIPSPHPTATKVDFRQFPTSSKKPTGRMPCTPPVRRPAYPLGPVKTACASTPSPTACVPVTSSSPAKTRRNIGNSGPISKLSGNPKPGPNGSIWNRWPSPNGCWRGWPKARAAYMRQPCHSKNSWPCCRVSTQRVRLEHSFRDAMRERKQLQRERKAQQQRQQPKQTVQAAKPDIPIPVNNPPPLSLTAGPHGTTDTQPRPRCAKRAAPSPNPHHPPPTLDPPTWALIVQVGQASWPVQARKTRPWGRLKLWLRALQSLGRNAPPNARPPSPGTSRPA